MIAHTKNSSKKLFSSLFFHSLFSNVDIDYGIFNDTLKFVSDFIKLSWTCECYAFEFVQLIVVRYADTDDKYRINFYPDNFIRSYCIDAVMRSV